MTVIFFFFIEEGKTILILRIFVPQECSTSSKESEVPATSGASRSPEGTLLHEKVAEPATSEASTCVRYTWTVAEVAPAVGASQV